uniref:Uncharacterized protein n=1 Tax=Amphimedon queenslandica TaxID=400682 RepID=A0A1X7TGS3_AMPQE
MVLVVNKKAILEQECLEVGDYCQVKIQICSDDVVEVQPAHSDLPALSYADVVDSDSGNEEDNDGAYFKGKTRNLATFEVYDIFLKALNDRGKLITLPRVKLAGWSMFVYDLALNETLHNSKRKQIRCDQYHLSHKGTHPLKHQNVTIMKKSGMIDSMDVLSGDARFQRHKYLGVDTPFIIHYVRDCSIVEGFAHRNSKYKKGPFIRSAPCLKKKV